MVSTSWAELYFRSLKTGNVLNQLTNYLLQYKRVTIPSVGTIHLVPQPPQLNVADKMILPPSFTAELKEGEEVPYHQLAFLVAVLKQEKEAVLQKLSKLGSRLKDEMQGDGFNWKGIGTLHHNNHSLPLSAEALEAVPAERVLRQDAEHKVLVGDLQMTSRQIAGLKEEEGVKTENKRSLLMIIGWIVLILSILYIVFVLYQGRFRVGATGSKSAPTGYVQKVKAGLITS